MLLTGCARAKQFKGETMVIMTLHCDNGFCDEHAPGACPIIVRFSLLTGRPHSSTLSPASRRLLTAPSFFVAST
jgi:hypothetical protein